MPEPVRCRHIHIEGRQCGSPALRHEKLCYQHHAARRPLARRPGDPLGPILPDPEDLPAVQRGLAELLRLVARELIDDKQAKLLFALLTEAGTNLARIDRARARQHALALSEARFAVRHPESSFSACPSRKESAYAAETSVVDLVSDPELGVIAPATALDPKAGQESNPAPSPLLESTSQSMPKPMPESMLESMPELMPQPEAQTPDLLPLFARHLPADEDNLNRYANAQAEAEAIAEARFQRLEEERREERRTLREAAEDVYRSRGTVPKRWLNLNPEEEDALNPPPPFPMLSQILSRIQLS